MQVKAMQVRKQILAEAVTLFLAGDILANLIISTTNLQALTKSYI